MENQTSLVKKPLGLEWKNGNSTIINNCQDQEALRKVLSEGFFQAISMYSKETTKDNVKIMIQDIIEDYSMEPVEVITMAIEDIRKGKRKIYGIVTPFDLREMITNNLEKLAIERERQHNMAKGYGNVEIADRSSGRISDFIPKLKK